MAKTRSLANFLYCPPLPPLPLPLLADAAGNRGDGIDAWNFRPIISTSSAGQPSSGIVVDSTGAGRLGKIWLDSCCTEAMRAMVSSFRSAAWT